MDLLMDKELENSKRWLTSYNCVDGGVKSREEKVSLDGGSLWTQGGTLTR
jgi:hypothetical protein